MAHNEALKCNAQQQRPQTTITNAALHLPLLTEAFLWVFRESIWWPARVNQRKRKGSAFGQVLGCCTELCCGLRKLTKAS